MVRSCSLKNCSNSVKQKYRFFVLPSIKKVAKRTAWLRKCGYLLPENLPMSGNSISLCEGHFEPDQFVEYGPNVRTILKPTAVPTIFTKNPPRVCDAVEIKYKKVLESGITNKTDIISHDVSLINSTENLDMITKSNDKNQSSDASELQTNNATFSSFLNPNLSQVEKELLSLSDSISLEQNESSTVKLLRIKKNCMLVSTPIGNKIVPAVEKNMTDRSNQSFDPILSTECNKNLDSAIDDTSPIHLICDEGELTSELTSTTKKPSKQVVLNLEIALENKLPQIGMDHIESLPNNNLSLVENNKEKLNNVEPIRVNIPSVVMLDNQYQLEQIQVMTKMSKKPFLFSLTPVTSIPETTPITPVASQASEENQEKEILHSIDPEVELLNESLANPSKTEAQLDDVIKLNSETEENFLGHEVSSNSNDFGKNTSVDDLKMVIRTAARAVDKEENSAFYSPVYTEPSSLRKRIHELEVERDFAIRKYRRLAMKMEVFYKNLKLFLNDDQIRTLETDSGLANSVHWSAETLQRSVKIRSIVGPKGYEYLRTKEHFPLPSFRSLYRHKNMSKLNEYTNKIIQNHMSNTINEVAAVEIENSDSSDIEIEKEILPEHIKIEMLDDESLLESEDKTEDGIVSDVNQRVYDFEDISRMEVVEYVTVNSTNNKKIIGL